MLPPPQKKKKKKPPPKIAFLEKVGLLASFAKLSVEGNCLCMYHNYNYILLRTYQGAFK